MRPTTGALIAMLVGTAGLAEASGMQSVGPEDPTDTVHTFVRANEAADLERTLSTFADDATVFMPGQPPERTSGTAAIREAFRRTYAQRKGAIAITLTDVHVQRVGETAIVTAHLRATPPGAAAGSPMVARRTFVLRRAGSRWLIVHLHASALPASQPQ